MFNRDKPFYMLVKGKVVPASMEQYLAWGGETDVKRVDYTELNTEEFALYPDGDYLSTVFLGIDHNHFGGEPLVFESMVFGGKFDGTQWRYHTLEEAQVGHNIIAQSLKAGLEPDCYDRNDPSWVQKFFEMYTGETSEQHNDHSPDCTRVGVDAVVLLRNEVEKTPEEQQGITQAIGSEHRQDS